MPDERVGGLQRGVFVGRRRQAFKRLGDTCQYGQQVG
jgi:hypothetical protein